MEKPADKLDTYRKKRSFEKTTEPSGDAEGANGANRFVIQEHHARRLHWDFRLERDGVLVSWALPRGVPDDPDQNRLAVHTEDHPLDYIDFAGEIPPGQYGAGEVTIWDSGTYEAEKWEPGKVVVRLEGKRVSGRYALFRTRGDDWMIHRMDPPEVGDPFPQRIEPMRPTRGRLPREDRGWGFEIRWDGVRTIAYCEPGHVRLEGPGGENLGKRFPEIGAIALELGGEAVVLDGQLVAFDDDGRPSAERLQRRLEANSDSEIRRRVGHQPATYIAFDLLYADRRELFELSYEQRRGRLEELGLDGASWQTPAFHRGEGEALLAATAERGLSGVIAKRLDSVYRPGKRSQAWIGVAAERR